MLQSLIIQVYIVAIQSPTSHVLAREEGVLLPVKHEDDDCGTGEQND